MKKVVIESWWDTEEPEVVATLTAEGKGPVKVEGESRFTDGLLVVDATGKRKLTYADGEEYLTQLPLYLHGGRVWAVAA